MELGKTVTLDFIVSDPTTGEPINADFTPSADVYEDTGAGAIYSPVPALRGPAVGHYMVTLVMTEANGFEKGKSYNLIIAATVGGVAGKMILSTFLIDETMEKKTNVAALLNVVAPPSFIPVVAELGVPEPEQMDNVYGFNSTHDNKELFVQYWSPENLTWKPGAEGPVPADYMAEVIAYQENINAYLLALAEWQANYDIQKEVQYRAMYADALISETE